MDEESVSAILTGAIIVLFVAFMLGHMRGEALGRAMMQGEAFIHGHGLYCPADGEFAWSGECPPKEDQ